MSSIEKAPSMNHPVMMPGKTVDGVTSNQVAPLHQKIGTQLPQPDRNVALRQILQEASENLRPGWMLRDIDNIDTGRSSEDGRPIVAHLHIDQAIERLYEWHSQCTEKTARQYTDRAGGFVRSFGKWELLADDAVEFANYIQWRCESVKSSTRRAYRSSSAFSLVTLMKQAQDGGPFYQVLTSYLVVDAAYVEGLAAAQLGESKNSPKCMPDEDMRQIQKALLKNGSDRARRIAATLNTSRAFGVRPIEARRISFFDGQGEMFSQVKIVNAKAVEGKSIGNGITRTLQYKKLDGEQLNILTEMEHTSAGFGDEEWALEIGRMQKLLASICKRIFRKSARKRYCLYDGRHQFAADMKLYYADHQNKNAIVAALMGHSSDRTANRHYARASKGRRLKTAPSPRPDELANVRVVDRNIPPAVSATAKSAIYP